MCFWTSCWPTSASRSDSGGCPHLRLQQCSAALASSGSWYEQMNFDIPIGSKDDYYNRFVLWLPLVSFDNSEVVLYVDRKSYSHWEPLASSGIFCKVQEKTNYYITIRLKGGCHNMFVLWCTTNIFLLYLRWFDGTVREAFLACLGTIPLAVYSSRHVELKWMFT